VRGAAEADRRMSELRRKRDWKGQIAMALDGRHAESIRKHAESGTDDACSMCGEFCVFKIADKDEVGF
jgi:phosphomethylpyrimidine synthase